MLAGVVGDRGHRIHGVFGDTVNLGARLEGQSPAGGVMIGAETLRAAPAGRRRRATARPARQGQGRAGGRVRAARRPLTHVAELLFESLDYVYVPTADVDAGARRYVDELGAELVWKVRGMGTVVACLRVSETGPAILLSGHLEGRRPILIYRVADYTAAIARLRESGIDQIHELEIPQGPCASFRVPDGQRFAIYELTRPGAADRFVGRVDD